MLFVLIHERGDKMIEYLAVIAMGPDGPDIVRVMTELVYDTHCEIESTHMNKYGEEFTMTFLISGSWSVIVKVEAALDKLQEEMQYDIVYKRTKKEPSKKPGIPYIVQLISPYDSGLLAETSAFFATQEINIKEVTGYRYISQQTEAEMFNLQLIVELPLETALSDLRERFMMFCDDLNVDATMEPDKF